MSRQQHKQEREEETKPERYSKAKPINDRLAAILTVIGCICGLVATWGGVDNHHTTMTVAIIVGVLCFAFAGYLHWTPQERIGKQTAELLSQLATLLLPSASASLPEPKLIEADTEAQPIPFEAEHDRLAKEVVRLRIQNERLLEQNRHNEYETTELQHDDLTQPNVVRSEPLEQPSHVQLDKEQEQILRLLFEHSWLSPTELQGMLNLAFQFVMYHLEELEKRRFVTGSRNVLPRIGTRYQISQKGREFAIKHKLHLPQQKISLVSQADVEASLRPQLCEVQEQILRALAEHNGESEKRFLRVAVDLLRFALQQQPLDGVTIDYHLHELEEQNYLSVTRNRRRGRADLFSLTQQGRKYVIDHGLNEGANKLVFEAATQREERVANAEKALLELQERTRHRKLATEQRSQLIPLLKQSPKAPIAVSGISDDAEVMGFVHDLASALQEGGCDVIALGTRTTAENFSGLKVLAVTIDDLAAIALHKSLNEAGLSASLELNPEHLVNPKMPKVPSWFFDENDPDDRLLKQMGECNVLWVGFEP